MKMKIKRLGFSIAFGIFFVSIIFTFFNTFSLRDNYKFESSVFTIEDDYIMGISSETDIDLFNQYFDLENCSVKVVDEEGNNIGKGYVYTGSVTLLYDHSNNVISRYKNIVSGDITKDGIVNNKDLEIVGYSLVYKEEMLDYQIKAMDINLDGKVKINDLIEIDKLLNSSYHSVTLNYEEYTLLSGEKLRLIGSISPDKILNQNLIWKSSNDAIAKVNSAGIVTAIKEGEVIITATTKDNKVSAQMKLVVDDTVRLKSNEGYTYFNGEKIRVGIRSVDYKNLSCESSNKSASCVIEGDTLVLEPLAMGSSVITVYNGDYGSATYNLIISKTYASVFPFYGCLTVNSSSSALFSTFRDDVIDFHVTDNEIIESVYLYNGNNFVVRSGSKPGRASVQVKESNDSMVNIFMLDVCDLRIPAIGGFIKVGEEVSTDIVGGNWHNLECIPEDLTKATCRIEDNKLIVKSLQKGKINIVVKNKITYKDYSCQCGQATFLAVMEE